MLRNKDNLIVAKLKNEMSCKEFPQLRHVYFKADSDKYYKFGSDCPSIIIDVYYFLDECSGIGRDVISILVSFVGEWDILQANVLVFIQAGGVSALLLQLHFHHLIYLIFKLLQ